MQGIKAICVLPYQSHVEQGFHFAVFAFCMRMPFDFSEQLLFFPAEYNAFALLFSFYWLTSFSGSWGVKKCLTTKLRKRGFWQ